MHNHRRFVWLSNLGAYLSQSKQISQLQVTQRAMEEEFWKYQGGLGSRIEPLKKKTW